MTIYSLDELLFLFGTSLLFHASWPAYKFLKRQVRCSGIPISFRIFHSLLWSTQSKRQKPHQLLEKRQVIKASSLSFNNSIFLHDSALEIAATSCSCYLMIYSSFLIFIVNIILSVVCCSVAKLCLTIYNPMNRQQAPLTSTISWVCSNSCQWCYLTISSSAAHPPFPFAFNLSQHQGLFQWISSLR